MATQSALQRAYRALQREKSKYCADKSTKTKVKAKATAYIKAAKKKGQTEAEAKKKANRILNGGCSRTSRVAGTKGRKTSRKRTTKRKSTRR